MMRCPRVFIAQIGNGLKIKKKLREGAWGGMVGWTHRWTQANHICPSRTRAQKDVKDFRHMVYPI